MAANRAELHAVTMIATMEGPVHVGTACEVIANPSSASVANPGGPRLGLEAAAAGQNDGLRFDWVFNSSSERIDLPSERVQVSGTRSLAEYMPKVRHESLLELVFTSSSKKPLTQVYILILFYLDRDGLRFVDVLGNKCDRSSI